MSVIHNKRLLKTALWSPTVLRKPPSPEKDGNIMDFQCKLKGKAVMYELMILEGKKHGENRHT